MANIHSLGKHFSRLHLFIIMKFVEVLMNIYLLYVVSSVVVNECTFCINEQQKLYLSSI